MISQSELKELLHYDPDTGFFTWKKSTNQSIKVGAPAKSINNKGYIVIGVGHKLYLAHRLAWLYVHGVFPEFIDHINHIRNDNRLCNLRKATRKENGRNQSIHKHNTSGANGVSWIKKEGVWRARITVNGRSIFLGRFSEKGDAIFARKQANIKYGFHENHGANI